MFPATLSPRRHPRLWLASTAAAIAGDMAWAAKHPAEPAECHLEMMYTGQAHGRPLIIFLPGLAASSRIAYKSLRYHGSNYLDGQGDTLCVEYPAQGFNLDRLRRQIVAATFGYKQIVVLGFSFGGLIGATMLEDLSDQLDSEMTISFIGVDPPMGAADLKQSSSLWLMKLIYAGWLTRTVWPHGQRAFLALQPKTEHEPLSGLGEELLQNQRRFQAAFPAAGYLEQLRYIAQHHGFEEGQFRDVPAAILDCTGNDIFVRDEAVNRWHKAFPQAEIISSTRGHSTVEAEPEAMKKALSQAFDVVLG